MTIGSKAWIEGIQYKTTNIAYGFIASGIWSAGQSYLRMVVSCCQRQIRL